MSKRKSTSDPEKKSKKPATPFLKSGKFDAEACIADHGNAEGVIIGIDEAGRGPVLGPLVYGVAWYPLSSHAQCLSLGVADSKVLKAEKREQIYKSIASSCHRHVPGCMTYFDGAAPSAVSATSLLHPDPVPPCLAACVSEGPEVADLGISYAVRVTPASLISGSMKRRGKVSLNETSLRAASSLVAVAVAASLKARADRGGSPVPLSADDNCGVACCFVDTVGPPEAYAARLRKSFPGVPFVVCPKADALYPVVSAASVMAKVSRDLLLDSAAMDRHAVGPHVLKLPAAVGSGYPGDPVTKKFIRIALDPLLGFPSIVRSSWATAADLEKTRCVGCHWSDEESDADDEDVQQIFQPSQPVPMLLRTCGLVPRTTPITWD